MQQTKESLYALLTPVKTSPPPREAVEIYSSLQTVYKLKQVLEGISGLIAVDIETQGTQAADPSTRIVGIGLATATRIIYFARPSCSDSVWEYLLEWLSSPSLELVGHNIFFDSAFLKRDSGRDYNWRYCTYGLYRQLASEGWPGQKWGLKHAQIELLGWQEKGSTELDRWLVDNDYISSQSKQPKPGLVRKYFPDEFDTELNPETKQQIKKPKIRFCKPDYSKMFLAPPDILGYYCGLDAASTYILLTEVMLPAVASLPPRAQEMFYFYHSEVFITNVKLNMEQQLRGILIATEKLEKHNEWLKAEIIKAEQDFLNHPEIKPLVEKYNQLQVAELLAAEPEKYKLLKLPKPPAVKTKKDGTISKAYITYEQKTAELLAKGPEISKNWLKWAEKLETAKTQNYFNINSGQQRQWLFYDQLKYPVKIRTEATEANPNGQPATDKKALLGFGEPGKLLKYNNDLVKEQSYVQACLDHLIDSKIHPQIRCPGTLTGRLSGSGGLNIQQLPGSEKYLRCWVARPGFKLVACDHDALENVVTTQLTGDKSLYKLYGPGQPPNDGHLFTGAAIPGLKEKILSSGYNPNHPTLEGIERAKKEAKKERSVAKTINYGLVYGAGANKLKETLELEGIRITLEEAKAMIQAYWKLYSGVKDYQKSLLDEWEKRGGWVYNGIGRPIGVFADQLRDIVNRCIAEGTTVFTRTRGLVPIQDVNPEEEVWDGQEWVKTQGPQYQGTKECINVNGVWMTPDHKVWSINNDWIEAGNLQGIHEIQEGLSPEYTWADVWRLSGNLLREVAKKLSNLCSRKM